MVFSRIKNIYSSYLNSLLLCNEHKPNLLKFFTFDHYCTFDTSKSESFHKSIKKSHGLLLSIMISMFLSLRIRYKVYPFKIDMLKFCEFFQILKHSVALWSLYFLKFYLLKSHKSFFKWPSHSSSTLTRDCGRGPVCSFWDVLLYCPLL